MPQDRVFRDFLIKSGMHPDLLDPETLSRDFAREMKRGLQGEESSLLMIPTYLSLDRTPKAGGRAAVIDAGGTNLRTARIVFDRHNAPTVESYACCPIPGSEREITFEVFTDTVAEHLLPAVQGCDAVGYCFSFPAEILPGCEARLIGFDKELQVKDAENRLICTALTKSLKKKSVSGLHVVLLNDTAAVLLGAAIRPRERCGGIAGMILGTGFNLCYSEQTNRIGKLAQGATGSMLINTEAGGFDKLPRGRADLLLDAESSCPGNQTLEKMGASGAYLGALFRITAQLAAAEGLLSAQCAERLQSFPDASFSCASLDAFVQNAGAGALGTLAETAQDRERLAVLHELLCERAAKLVITAIAGVLRHTGAGKDPARPFCISAEGSVFEKAWFIRHKIDLWAERILTQKLGRSIRFVKVENATLVGSAAAALFTQEK